MYKRIVVKVGTSVLSDEKGNINIAVLKSIVDQIVSLTKQGIAAALVTSGAVGVGKSMLQLSKNNRGVKKQVLASIGQAKLMSLYANFFEKRGLLSAQVLVTKEDFRDRVHYTNMKNCFLGLLMDNVVPIINENDAVSTTELFFTDNDELAGLVASQLGVDAVIILTDVDGIIMRDNSGRDAVIPEVDASSYELIKKSITPEKSVFGRGGMLTKYTIAKKLALQGIAVHIANGKAKNILTDIVRGKRAGTIFVPNKKPSSIKRRLAHSEGFAKGSVFVNKCTENMLLDKKKIISLLPVGITKIAGNFKKGDIIEIKNKQNKILGFGIAQYNAAKAKKAAGKKNMKAAIHYNYMFIDG